MRKLKLFFELIKFEHTVFALPFAYLGMLLAQKRIPSLRVFFWVTAAMVAARTAGMTLNRLIDLPIDRKNPRTSQRPTVTGEFPARWAWVSVAAALAVFFVSAGQLNPLCFKLAFVAIVLLCGYHYVKRFSWLCHFALGLVLAAAPLGGWMAVTGNASWVPALLSLAVLFWVAGFDIIYSLQDMDFDKAQGLHSIPVRFGASRALAISDYCHWATTAFLVLFGLGAQLGIVYWVGVVVTTTLLRIEQRIISDQDLSRIQTAFFTINGWIGILLLIFVFLDIFK